MLLIDGSHLLHRVLSTSQSKLVNRENVAVGGIHGFIISLSKLASDYRFEKGIAVAWDLSSSKHRRDIYPLYKGGRTSYEEELKDPELNDERRSRVETYTWCRRILHGSLLPLSGSISLQLEGIEADDIISFLSKNATPDGDRHIIVSSDKDLIQLVSDSCDWYDPIRKYKVSKESMLEDGWSEKNPQQHFLIHKALQGDGSDQIPGVRGIGSVWAKRLGKIILEEGVEALEKESSSKANVVLDNLEILERNMKLMDLINLPEEVLKTIRSHVESQKSSYKLDISSLEYLRSKLVSMELFRASEVCDSIIDANFNSSIPANL